MDLITIFSSFLFTMLAFIVPMLIFLVAIVVLSFIFYNMMKSNNKNTENLSDKNISELSESGITQGVILVMQYNPSQYLLNNINPKIEIDSRSYEAKWGINEIDLDPGHYQLECFFPYMGMERSCKASIEFEIKENDVVKMKYEPPLVIFVNGTIKVFEDE